MNPGTRFEVLAGSVCLDDFFLKRDHGSRQTRFSKGGKNIILLFKNSITLVINTNEGLIKLCPTMRSF